jgi:hypothetical protein
LVLACGTSAFAQTNVKQPALFISAGGATNMQWFGTDAGSLDGRTPAMLLSVGTSLSPRWSLRFELNATTVLKSTETFTVTTIAAGAQSSTQVYTIVVRQQAPTGLVLLGWQTRGERVHLEYLMGFGFGRDRTDTPLPREASTYTEIHYGVAGAAGIDVVIRMARHWDIVPQVRGQMFNGVLAIRPGISLRLNF